MFFFPLWSHVFCGSEDFFKLHYRGVVDCNLQTNFPVLCLELDVSSQLLLCELPALFVVSRCFNKNLFPAVWRHNLYPLPSLVIDHLLLGNEYGLIFPSRGWQLSLSEVNQKLVFGEVRKLLFSVVKREFYSHHCNVLYCLQWDSHVWTWCHFKQLI